ncbi:uncharacterized protein LOC117029760 [Rhinolophus ferrumequinum]|uniref:uncharacterized protein LOC117029760 n=1 Tax=Rhinolophus ferrumequinum TaxID=59479 RepID=UPI00140F8C3C|nr:uncharacterized protein LOC117029760 [Rhinolophus ferrumequinum]
MPRKTWLRPFTRGTPMKTHLYLPMHHGQWLAWPCCFQTLCFQPQPPRGPNPTSLEPDFIGLEGIELPNPIPGTRPPYQVRGANLLQTIRSSHHVTAAPVRGTYSVTTPREEKWRLYGTGSVEQNPEAYRADFLELWAEDNPPGLAKHKAPVLVKLRPGAQHQWLRQYPISREARAGNQEHLVRLRAAGILVECQLPWNTPLLPVRKSNGEYRPVQDLRAVNQATVSRHAVVPNPYTLPSQLPPEAGWLTCVDLKDVFFCIWLAPQSQSLFTFKWTELDTGRQLQLTWTRLPEDFKNSPILFGEAVASDLATFP